MDNADAKTGRNVAPFGPTKRVPSTRNRSTAGAFDVTGAAFAATGAMFTVSRVAPPLAMSVSAVAMAIAIAIGQTMKAAANRRATRSNYRPASSSQRCMTSRGATPGC